MFDIDLASDESGLIGLLELPTPGKCAYTGCRIREGRTAVAVGNPETELVTFVFDPDCLDAVLSDLDDASFETLTPLGLKEKLEIVPGGTVKNTNGHCAVCGDRIHAVEDYLGTVTSTTFVPHGGKAYVHGECLDRFRAALDRTWEHSPHLLAERV